MGSLVCCGGRGGDGDEFLDCEGEETGGVGAWWRGVRLRLKRSHVVL